jgi:DNA-binding transcriptional MerR regulator
LDNKAPYAFRTISEVADDLDLPQHVLRFWESRFREIKPMKRGGGRRYYRPDDVDLLRGIRHLLYGEGYTIRGVQRILREQSVGFVQAVWQDGAPQPPHGGSDEEDAGEVAETEVETYEDEPRGLRERFSSLIGRDLGDHAETPGDRRDPPLQSGPMPHVDPADRAIFDGAAPIPARSNAAPASSAASGQDQVNKLHAALHELMECRKLIDGAMARDQ